MTFYEQELRKLFEDGTIIAKPAFVGRACLGDLGGDIRVRAEFITMGVADNYEALRLTVLNRSDGPVDKLTLRFFDLWGKKQVSNPNFREGIVPRIWNDGNKAAWYVYAPNKADYDVLRDACRGYLEVFREPQIKVKSKTTDKTKQRPCR